MASLPTPEDIDLAQQLSQNLGPNTPEAIAEALADPVAGDWSTGFCIERGKDHRIVVLPDVAVLRISRRGDQDIQRQTTLLNQLQEHLTWKVPLPYAATDRAVLLSFIEGTAHPHGSGDPEYLRSICQHLKEVPVEGLGLTQPFAQRGRLSREARELLKRLPRELEAVDFPENFDKIVDPLLDAVDEFTDNPEVEPGLVHGDLAGHNMCWVSDGQGGYRLNGILDWDQACAWDPALNPAYLSLWHGEEMLDQLCSDENEYRRAHIWLASHALDSIHDAAARSIPASSWRRLLKKTLPRVERGAKALESL